MKNKVFILYLCLVFSITGLSLGAKPIIKRASHWILSGSTLSPADSSYNVSIPSTVVGTVSNLGTNLSSTCAINVEDGAVQTGTVTGDTEFTFSGWADSGYSKDVTLKLVNAGAHSLTWDSAIDWPAGSEPALTTSGTDILYFFSLDGGTTVIGSHCLPNVQ
jgi:hypothetical protein